MGEEPPHHMFLKKKKKKCTGGMMLGIAGHPETSWSKAVVGTCPTTHSIPSGWKSSGTNDTDGKW